MPPGRQAKRCNGCQMFEINCCLWRQKMATVRNKKGEIQQNRSCFKGEKDQGAKD